MKALNIIYSKQLCLLINDENKILINVWIWIPIINTLAY